MFIITNLGMKKLWPHLKKQDGCHERFFVSHEAMCRDFPVTPLEQKIWASSNVVRFDLGTLLQGQMRVAKLKSAYISRE